MVKSYIIGIDEVGRGPVAGPVTVCAFKISTDFYDKLQADNFFEKLRDSKKLSIKKREEWFKKLKQLSLDNPQDLSFAVLSKTAMQIDRFGISNCIKKLISEDLEKINAAEKDQIFLDGSLSAPDKFLNQETIIKGDEKIPVIACASIMAKVTRDYYMTRIAEKFPEYGFEQHKGYGTSKHMEAIKKHGTSAMHRLTYLKNF